MEQMIWFLRLFSVFFLVLAIVTYSRDEISLAQSTTTIQKFEPAIKLILQRHSNKLARIPTIGESIIGNFDGEEVQIRMTEWIPNQKVSIEILNLPHSETISETHIWTESLESNLVHSSYFMKTKPDLLSRIIFLFFGKSTLQKNAENVTKLIGQASKP